MTNGLVIHTERLGKSYGRVEAVKELNLSIRPHSITAFLGLNGAGKSTTIKMLLGMIRPSSGDGTILGQRISDPIESVRIRTKIAYVSENKRLYDYMTADQMIRFASAFYPDWRREEAQKLLRQFELPLDRKVKSLSKGMRTKLGLLIAFARQPELLILDEPSEGLDPVGIEELLEILVARCSEGHRIRLLRLSGLPTKFASSMRDAWCSIPRLMISASRIGELISSFHQSQRSMNFG
jgi:ABC-2 type transport system ATP-binding protein